MPRGAGGVGGAIHLDYGIRDFERAVALDPNSREARSALATQRAARRERDASGREALKGMFARRPGEDTDPSPPEPAVANTNGCRSGYSSLSSSRPGPPASGGGDADGDGDRMRQIRDTYRECVMQGATQRHGVWFDRDGWPLI